MKSTAVSLLLSLLASASVMAEDKLDLDWLAGHWCSRDAKESSEEYWLPARGGIMLGLNRSVARNRTSFEFMRIEFTGKGARFLGQPSGAPPTSFELVDAGARQVTFANPQHDFPKRIRYARNGETLTARVDDGREDSQEDNKSLEFKWQRCGNAGT